MSLLDEAYVGHVQRCVAWIDGTANGGDQGTGWFVDTDLVMTCAHVAGTTDTPVTLRLFGGVERTGQVIESAPIDGGDVAMIRLAPLDPPSAGGEWQPALSIARLKQTSRIAVAPGFPGYKDVGGLVTGMFRVVELDMTVVTDPNSNTPVSAQLAGEVDGGLSGSPVISLPDHRVTALVRSQAPLPSGLRGGLAIPIDVAAQHLPTLAALLEQPPVATSAWLRLTGQLDNAPPRRRIDLAFVGDACRWTVGEPSGALQPEVTVRELGDTVGRAVFGWLSGRRPRSPDEVKLSGELLGVALLSGAAGQRVWSRARTGAAADVRIMFRDADELQDAPWELATITASEECLSTRSGSTFTRVDADAAVAGGAAELPSLLVLPLGPYGLVRERDDGAETDPIGTKGYYDRVRFASRAKNPGYVDEVAITAEGGVTPSIVHYAGFVRVDRDGVSELLIQSADGNDFLQLTQLAADCADAGVRLLVVESLSPRPQLDWGPAPPPSSYLGLLAGSLEAIVFTQFGVSDRMLRRFNGELYKQLSAGESVERAVQAARAVMRKNNKKDEPSAFGSFAVITGPGGGPQLLRPWAAEAAPGNTQAQIDGALSVRPRPESV